MRVEELYPWPHDEVAQIVDLYPAVEEVVWAQEEPKNMGAWTYVSPRLRVSTGNAMIVRYIGRPERASPAEGYASAHKAEQERIVSRSDRSDGAAGGIRGAGRAVAEPVTGSQQKEGFMKRVVLALVAIDDVVAPRYLCTWSGSQAILTAASCAGDCSASG